MVSLCWLGCTTPSDFSAVLFQVDSSEVKKVSFHPYEGEELPPVNTQPPSQEALEMMQKLDAKFGITYHFE